MKSAIDQANAASMNTADAFGNKLGGGNNETSKSLAVRDMMMNAAGYNPNIKGYDNPFNQGMGLDVGYSSYDKLIGKGYTPQEIARMEFTQSKGLLGDMKFNATLDGISGIVIGNIFKVREDRLPKAYQKTRIGFIVFSEDQKVTAGGDWTTEISGKMTILPEPGKKPIINGISTSTFTDADILNEPATTAFGSLTQELAEGQGRVTDIAQATTTEPVFLKKMADNSIHNLFI